MYVCMFSYMCVPHILYVSVHVSVCMLCIHLCTLCNVYFHFAANSCVIAGYTFIPASSKCYWMSSTKQNYADAKTTCETKAGSYGGNLAIMNDLAVTNAVVNTLFTGVNK